MTQDLPSSRILTLRTPTTLWQDRQLMSLNVSCKRKTELFINLDLAKKVHRRRNKSISRRMLICATRLLVLETNFAVRKNASISRLPTRNF